MNLPGAVRIMHLCGTYRSRFFCASSLAILEGNTLPCVEATLLSLCLSLSKATGVSLLL